MVALNCFVEMELRVRIIYFHNILWSRYRISLFNELHQRMLDCNQLLIVQIARTEKNRIVLGNNVDLKILHEYQLLYDGAYEDLNFIKKLFFVTSIFFRVKSDLVVVTGYASFESWLVLMIAKIFRKKILLTVDSSIYEYVEGDLTNILKRFFIRNVNAVLAYGRSSKLLVNKLSSDCKVFHPFHCVEERFYKSIDDMTNSKLLVSKEVFTFLFVGRLSKEKWVLELVLSFSAIFRNDRLVLLKIVGDGPLRSELESLLLSCDVDNVRLEGPLSGDKLFSAYTTASCLVLPSVIEPWGLVVNESLCAGTPVIVSDRCGCVPDLVEGNQGAIKFQSGSKSDLERALIEGHTRFKHLDESMVRSCIRLGQSYSSQLAADTFLNTIKVL